MTTDSPIHGGGSDRTALEVAAAEARAELVEATARVTSARARAHEADLSLAHLDLGPEASPRLVRRAAELRSVLSDAGHPVLDVLLLPSGSGSVLRPGGHVVRVEFLHGRGEVGVLRGHLDWSTLEVLTSDPLPVFVEVDELPAYLDTMRWTPSVSDAAPTRVVASNDDLRELLAAPEGVRETAARLTASLEGDVGLAEVTAALGLLRLEVELRPRAASAAGADVVVGLVRDLASGAPEEWALHRATRVAR